MEPTNPPKESPQRIQSPPLLPKDLPTLFQSIEIVLNDKTIKPKLDSSAPSLMIKLDEMTFPSSTFNTLFTFTPKDYTISPTDKDKYSYIFDFSNYISFVKDDKTPLENTTPFNEPKLKSYLDNIKDKGTIVLMIDTINLKQLSTGLTHVFGENYKTNLFIKLIVIKKYPFISLLFIQKMGESKEPINILTQKLLIYEVFDHLKLLSKPTAYEIGKLSKTVDFLCELFYNQDFLKTYHPGQVKNVNIKQSYDNNNIVCHFTIYDSNIPALIAKKNCACLIIEKCVLNEYLYFNPKNLDKLCLQVMAARIIVLRPSPFNFDSLQKLKMLMEPHIISFRFDDCVNGNSIPILLIGNDNIEKEDLKIEGNYYIGDYIDNKTKEIYRQLMPSNINDVIYEVKLILSSAAKMKKENEDDENMTNILPSSKRYDDNKKLNLVCKFDKNVIRMFYHKVILSSFYFADLEQFPDNCLNILNLGAGIGLINYHLNSFLKEKVIIDSVEHNKKIIEIGKEYFGTNNYNFQSKKDYKNNINWIIEEPIKYLSQCQKENYYDLIIYDLYNNNLINDGMSPAMIYFEDEALNNVKRIMKNNGIFIFKIKTQNYQKYLDVIGQIEKHFPSSFSMENNDDLMNIHFCFKSKFDNDVYAKRFADNDKRIHDKKIVDFGLIEDFYKKTIARVNEVQDIKNYLIHNSKL